MSIYIMLISIGNAKNTPKNDEYCSKIFSFNLVFIIKIYEILSYFFINVCINK